MLVQPSQTATVCEVDRARKRAASRKRAQNLGCRTNNPLETDHPETTHLTATCSCEDYRDGGAVKTMALKPDEFIRRFLLHALPDGFHRIRHFGFLANGHRTERLALCRSLMTNQVEPTAHREEEPASPESDNRIGVDPPPGPEGGGA